MINMSNFNLDIYIEHEINKYLDTHIYPLLEKEFGLVFNRVTDMNLQHAGVDIVGKHKLFNKKLNIDEKTASHHFANSINDTGLPTFALELSYFKEDDEKVGWLFNPKYSKTDAYLFSWGWRNSEDKDWKTIKYNDIVQMESVLVLKKDLIKYLDKHYDFNLTNYESIDNNSNSNSHKYYIKESKGPYIYNSGEKYNERPINLVFPKHELIKISKFHTIHKIEGDQNS